MRRIATHRADYRTGPHHSWIRRKTYHLSKVMKPGHVGIRVVDAMRCERPGLYAIPPVLVMELRDAILDFRPYAEDETGEVWA